MNKPDKMRVFLFEIEPIASSNNSILLSDVIEDIDSITSLDKRLCSVSGSDMKLEQIQKSAVAKNCTVYYLDFCKHRESGPGRASQTQPIKGFDLQQGESFGEMTAALYVPGRPRDYIIVQHNQYGVRHGAIARYFTAMSHCNVSFSACLDEDTEHKLENSRYCSSFTFGYRPQPNIRGNSGILALDKAHDILSADPDAAVVDVKISKAPYKGKRMQGGWKEMVKQIYSVVDDDDSSVVKLKAEVSNDLEEEVEVLDLINGRESKDFDINYDVATRQYPFEKRCDRLNAAMRDWVRERRIAIKK